MYSAGILAPAAPLTALGRVNICTLGSDGCVGVPRRPTIARERFEQVPCAKRSRRPRCIFRPPTNRQTVVVRVSARHRAFKPLRRRRLALANSASIVGVALIQMLHSPTPTRRRARTRGLRDAGARFEVLKAAPLLGTVEALPHGDLSQARRPAFVVSETTRDGCRSQVGAALDGDEVRRPCHLQMRPAGGLAASGRVINGRADKRVAGGQPARPPPAVQLAH